MRQHHEKIDEVAFGTVSLLTFSPDGEKGGRDLPAAARSEGDGRVAPQ